MAKRRSVLFRFGLMEAGLVLTVLLGLSACSSSSGDGDSGGSSGASAVPVPGTVNTKEIGGTNLTVQSAYGEGSVGPTGFTISVSPESSQLLFVEDGNGAIRGLAFAVTRGVGEEQAIQIDATSTALGLIFVSPGLATTDPNLALTRISEFKALPSFAAVVTFLKSALPTQNLTTLKDGQLNDLLSTCITDWLKDEPIRIALRGQSSSASQFIASVAATIRSVTSWVVPIATAAPAPQEITQYEAGKVRFSKPNSPSNPAAVPVTIENGGYRFVKIYKVPYDLENKVVFNELKEVPTPPNNLKGIVPLGLTNIFVGRAGDPTTIQDTVNLSPSRSKVQYWIVGPGFGGLPSGDLPVEAGHSAHGFTNAVDVLSGRNTFIEYFVPPFMKVIAGNALSDEEVKLIVTILVDAATGKLPTPAENIYTFCCKEGADLKERAAAMMSYLKLLLTELARHPEAALEAKDLVKRLNRVDSIFGTYNLLVASYHFLTLPHVDFVELKNGWLGAWSGTMTSTCPQWYSGPMTFWIQPTANVDTNFDGRLSVTPFPFLPIAPGSDIGYSWSPGYKGNTAVNPDMTLNGDSLTLTDTSHCQTATMSRGGIIPGCPTCK